jgi:hypothetical protein
MKSENLNLLLNSAQSHTFNKYSKMSIRKHTAYHIGQRSADPISEIGEYNNKNDIVLASVIIENEQEGGNTGPHQD